MNSPEFSDISNERLRTLPGLIMLSYLHSQGDPPLQKDILKRIVDPDLQKYLDNNPNSQADRSFIGTSLERMIFNHLKRGAH